jgi:sec-independent protein translocase protein TatA
MLQMNEMMWIALVVLLLFGGTRIPALMRSLGRGAGEFQKGIEEGKSMLEKGKQEALGTHDADR